LGGGAVSRENVFRFGEENACIQRSSAKPLGASPEAIAAHAFSFLFVLAHALERSINFTGRTTWQANSRMQVPVPLRHRRLTNSQKLLLALPKEQIVLTREPCHIKKQNTLPRVHNHAISNNTQPKTHQIHATR